MPLNHGEPAVEIGVAKNDVGRLPAELQSYTLERIGRAFIFPANAVDPVKAILSMPGCWTMALPTSGPPVTMFRHARWNACFDGQFTHPQRCERRLLGGLEDDGVAASKRGAEFP